MSLDGSCASDGDWHPVPIPASRGLSLTLTSSRLTWTLSWFSSKIFCDVGLSVRRRIAEFGRMLRVIVLLMPRWSKRWRRCALLVSARHAQSTARVTRAKVAPKLADEPRLAPRLAPKLAPEFADHAAWFTD